MDAARFDAVTRVLAASPSRRMLMSMTLGGLLGGVGSSFSGTGDRLAAAQTSTPAALATPTAAASVCSRRDVADLQSRMPGDLVGSEEITPHDDPAFPAGARAWRVLYVSTGRDNTERTLSCGVVVAPADAARISVRDVEGKPTGRVVAWAHGTLGVVQRCQPSEDPSSEIWGPPPFGINQVSWGSEARGDLRTGAPENGMLAGMIDEGWIVAATDYASDPSAPGALQPFVIGKMEAANVIDSIRAAHHLVAGTFDGYPIEAYDAVTWGHSQGGHSAMWAGQLLEPYALATAAPDGPALKLSGVALEAPVSNIISDAAAQGEQAMGFGLLDWTAHAELQLTGQPRPIPLPPFFFSYVFGAWAQHSAGGAPDPAAMPAYPDAGTLDLAAAVTPAGVETVDEMTALCWADGEQVATLAAPYATAPFLVPPFADGPVVDGRQQGGIDQTCAGDPPPDLAAWCAWIRYNNPGPLGDNPFQKIPTRNGQPVPVLITAGANDGVVHCVAPDTTADAIPSAHDCAPVALYDALRGVYCPAEGVEGYLELLIWREEPGVTVADHSDVTGLVAAAALDDLRFQGSPLQRFISGAFDGTLGTGCSAAVANGTATA